MCEQNKFTFEVNSCEVRSSVNPGLVGPSCLRNSDRSKKGGITRNVSFPDDDSQMVTGILEPENPWKSVYGVSNEDLIFKYISSCKKHGTDPIPTVLDQLSKFELKVERNKIFTLKGVTLNAVICETLEEILKHIQFSQINLESTDLDDEASAVLFDMLEYYEAVTHLNISSNPNVGVRGWQACARMIKKAYCLEALEARNTTLNEVSMPILGRALRVGSQLQVLKLENCNLSGRPLIILAAALKVNNNLKELYLGENNLNMSDANQLGSMLKCNATLKLLNISHNDIKDVGLNYIIEGLISKNYVSDGTVNKNSGLTILMAWNNQLTKNIAHPVVRLLEKHTDLETLNVGQNCLGNEFLRIIKDKLTSNKNLLRLGLQSTSLTNEAAFLLADVLKQNSIIQRVDIRDNNIQVFGLAALVECLKENNCLIRLDLDKLPRKGTFNESAVAKYKSLVAEIRERCAENEKNILELHKANSGNETPANEIEDAVHELHAKYRNLRLSVADSRKISLTCESLHFRPPTENTNYLGEPKKGGRLRSPAPSPIPSPVSSPSPVRNRFQVSKVIESHNEHHNRTMNNNGGNGFNSSSRFTVTIVEPETKPLTDNNLGDGIKESHIKDNVEKCHASGKENKSEDHQIIRKSKNATPTITTTSSCTVNVVEQEEKKPTVRNPTNVKKETVSVDRMGSLPKNKEIGSSSSSSSSSGGGNPITEKIRKLSWVTPILQAPSVVVENAKIPNNLEKLLNLFQNPFVRSNRTKSTETMTTTTIKNNEIHRGTSDGETDTNSVAPNRKTVIVAANEKFNGKDNRSHIDLVPAACEESASVKLPRLENDVVASTEDDVADAEMLVIESKPFTATWPQKLSTNYLPSPSKSSPNILEATAFMLLQGHMSSDLTK